MTTLIGVTGSSIIDAGSQLKALVGSSDYVQDIRLVISADKDLTGTQYTITAIKNNGHFAGYSGADRTTVTTSSGSLTQVKAGLTPGTDEDVTAVAIYPLGSPTTGSITYYGVKVGRTYPAV